MTIPNKSDAPVSPPSADAVEDAIVAFERLWQGVSQGARSSLVTERNEVRRVLTRLRDFIRASEARPTLNAASPDGEARAATATGAEPADPFAQELRAFYDWLVSKTPDERKYVLEMLDARFCVDCGEHFETRGASDEHECEEGEDDGGEDDGGDDEGGEDDEDAPPSSGPASTKTDLAPAPERE